MRIPLALFCTSALVFTVGCAFQPRTSTVEPSSTPTPTITQSPPPAVTPQYLYTANGLFRSTPTGTISGFTIDASTGVLTSIAGSPFDAGLTPYNLATDVGRNLYFANISLEDDNLRVAPISASSGVLASARISTFTGGNYENEVGCCPGPVVVDAGGRFAYIGNTENNTVDLYGIDATTKAFKPLATVTVQPGHFPTYLAFDTDQKFLFVLTDGGQPQSLLYVFWRDQYSGRLTPASGPYSFSVATQMIQMEDGHYLVVAENPGSVGHLRLFTIRQDGTLAELAASPFALTNQSVSRAQVTSLAIDPQGTFLATALTSDTNSISLLRTHADGSLTPSTLINVPGSASWTLPSIAFDVNGDFLYVSNDATAQISGFSLNRGSETLNPINGSPWTTGEGPHSVLILQPE